MGWRGAIPIFFAFMLITFVSVAPLKVHETRADVPPSVGSCLSLLKESVFAYAVLGIFLYVGAEVSMARFLKPTLEALGVTTDKSALLGPTFFFGALTVGRLVGGGINVSARNFFRVSGLLGLVGVALVMTGVEVLCIIGVIVGGLGFANIWPMLFSITVEERPDRSSELSGLMCMAISGGAVVPLVMGELMDRGLASMSYIVPGICFGYLLLLSLKGGRKPASA
jgi:fucose permease